VERRPDASDRRIWRLHLTPAAAPMLKEIAKARTQLNALLVDGIPAKSLDAAIDCLLEMKANLTADQRSNVKSA
jgi:DNA-binding MarR family transcriptional regulator